MAEPGLEKEKRLAVRAARAAGEIIRSLYDEKGAAVSTKAGGSPVTRADVEANRAIHRVLRGAFPEDGWLSEETADSPERLSRRRVWVVDPMDGTREFIQKIPEFAVSVALVEDGRPVVAVSYNPASGELFCAARAAGATRNGERIAVSPTSTLPSASVLASRSEHSRGEWDACDGMFQITPVGSAAYKLSLVASGKFDATFTLVPKNEWDVCAGALILEEAGGTVTDLDGRPLNYNRKATLLEGLVASNGLLHGQILDLVAHLRRER